MATQFEYAQAARVAQRLNDPARMERAVRDATVVANRSGRGQRGQEKRDDLAGALAAREALYRQRGQAAPTMADIRREATELADRAEAIVRAREEATQAQREAKAAAARVKADPAVLQQAITDARERHAYLDNAGNYRLRGENGGRSQVAPWNRTVKSAFATPTDFFRAAHENRVPSDTGTARRSGARPTLTSARAQLRDLTAKVNAADAEVNRAVNSPRDSQDYHRSYTALQAARNERDRFLASLPADLRDKVTTGAATVTARARTGGSKSAGTTTRTTPAPYETAIGPRAHWHDEQDLRAAANQWAAKMGAKVRSLTFADMPRKWGQMDTNGHMVLSRELLNLPPRLGEYVMAHEAAHALVPNHGMLFGLTLSAYMPDWRERDAELRKLGISETGATRRKTKAAATA